MADTLEGGDNDGDGPWQASRGCAATPADEESLAAEEDAATAVPRQVLSEEPESLALEEEAKDERTP